MCLFHGEKTPEMWSDVLRLSVFRSVGLTNPTVKDQCQFRSGLKPMLGKSLHICALLEHHPGWTEPIPCWETQWICFRVANIGRTWKKKAQYVEISHACRAQKRPIIIILLQVMLLKIPNTARTSADFSLVGCRFFCLHNKTNLPSADS